MDSIPIVNDTESIIATPPSLPPLIIACPTVTFPLIYRNFLGEWRGIYIDMWSAIAAQLGRRLDIYETDLVPGGYSPDSSGLFDGVLGLLQNQTITAAVSNYAPTADRCHTFQCSSGYNSGPALEWYVQGGSSSKSFFLQLLNFIPFTSLISILFIVFYSSLFVFKKIIGNTRRLSYGIHISTSLLFSFLVSLLFNVAFTGNAIMVPSIRNVPVSDVLSLLHKGKDYLILQKSASLKSEDYPNIFGTTTPSTQLIIEPDAAKIVNMLCSSEEYIFHDKLFTLSQTNTRRMLTLPCPLQKVDTSASLPSFIPYDSMLYTLGTRDVSPVNLYRPSDTKLHQAASFVILSLYDSDKFEGLMYRRYTGRDQMIREGNEDDQIYKPLQLANIYALFVVTFISYTMAFIIFILETQHHFFARLYRIIMTKCASFLMSLRRRSVQS